MAYKQYGGDKMSSPLKYREKRDGSISNAKFRRRRAFRAWLHGGMADHQMNKMRERAFQRRLAADDELNYKIDSHLPPRQNYEGWTDFQIQQAEAARGREISSVRNRVMEEKYNS